MTEEKQAHYLGVIAGYRTKLSESAQQDEQRKELKARKLAAAFAATDIESIWTAAKDIVIPHYLVAKRMCGVGVRLGACGVIKTRRGMAYALKINSKLYGGPEWSCRLTGGSAETVRYYAQQPSPFWDEKRFDFSGELTKAGAPYTADDMRESFIQFLLIATPPNSFDNIAPVTLEQHTKIKTKRKVIAIA